MFISFHDFIDSSLIRKIKEVKHCVEGRQEFLSSFIVMWVKGAKVHTQGKVWAGTKKIFFVSLIMITICQGQIYLRFWRVDRGPLGPWNPDCVEPWLFANMSNI